MALDDYDVMALDDYDVTPTPIVDEQTKLATMASLASAPTVTLTAAERAAATIKAREDAYAAELERRAATKPTTDPGIGNGWVYSVREGRWKLVRFSTSINNPPPAPMTPTNTSGTSNTSNIMNEQNKEKERQDAFELMSARFNEYGLGALIPVMKQLIWEDVSEDTMWLRLQETDTFKQRFSANEARRKAGLRVLSVSEYVGWEDAYRQVIRSYGLKQFDNDEYVNKFLANDVSITELTNRVTLATKRLKDTPDVVKELKTFYGGVLADSDILGYVLDPKNELQRIERMVAASEIGAAAQQQGLQVGGAMTSEAERMAAEELAAYGVTQEVARQGYSTIADILPASEKLSDIYGARLDKYGQKEAEQEVFKGTASAKRARQKLIATELGTFSGGAGTARGAFATETTL